MDKETLSNYGWIVICVLVLAVMIALSGPFGTFVANAVKSTTQGLFDVNQNALDAAGITIDDNAFPACDHTYENYKCTQCGDVIEHTCNYENSKCTLCGKELPSVGISAEECSWAELKAIAEAGLGDDYFNIGDEKTFVMTDGTEIVMQIAGFNADEKSDGTGTVGIVWISKYIVDSRVMNSTKHNTNGWRDTELRAWLQGEFYSKLPSEVTDMIEYVDKSYHDATTSSTQVCSDNLWIPSCHEVTNSGTAGIRYETSGAVYHTYFKNYGAKTTVDGVSKTYWSRSAYGFNVAGAFQDIMKGGSCTSSEFTYANQTMGVVFGFCI